MRTTIIAWSMSLVVSILWGASVHADPLEFERSIAESLDRARGHVESASSAEQAGSCGGPSRSIAESRLVDGDFNDLSQLAGPCRPCSRTRDVAVVLVSPPLSDDPREAIAMASVTGYRTSLRFDGLPTRYYEFTGSTVLRKALLNAARSCERVKRLFTLSHGAPGRLATPIFGVDAGALDELLQGGLHCAMAEGAEIQFDGCNIGRGCRGEDFLMGVAAHLLRKGGTVRAPTQYEVAILVTPPIPLSLDYQELTVRPGLQEYSWDNAPQSASVCADRVRDEIQALREVAARAQRRGVIPDALEQAAPLLASAEASELAQRELGLWPHDRTGFSREHRRRASEFARVVFALRARTRSFRRQLSLASE